MLSVFNQGMAEGFYKLFWQECGSKGLSIQQKVDALCKLKDLSLRMPYWELMENDAVQLDGKKDKRTLTDLFPELIPTNLCKNHIHLTKLTGLLLYVVYMEIFYEIKQLAQDGKLTTEQIEALKQ